MECCGNCLGDRYLKEVIIPIYSEKVGVCPCCESVEQVLIEAAYLRDYIEQVVVVYEECDDGKSLAELLLHDWGLFNHPNLNKLSTQALLGEILNDGEIVRKKYRPRDEADKNTTRSWADFKDEIMHNNRFFPGATLDIKRLRKLFKLLEYKLGDEQTVWFRTRIQKDKEKPYVLEDMGAPPKEKASHGRANPIGIPYLYLASDSLTAVSETHPHTGEVVSIAEFEVDKDVDLIDLRSPKVSASPFDLADSDEIDTYSLRSDIRLLELLGKELSIPILPDAAALNYIPTQYLCELIKNCGYEGVIYGSAMGEGMNLALFDLSKANAKVVGESTVSKVKVTLN